MKRNNIKKILLVIACGAVLCASIATTIAWLVDSANVQNQFVPGVVGCVVDETIANGLKTEVKVLNKTNATPEANVPAFIRVALVPVWRDGDGNGTRYEADLPGFTLNTTAGWFQKGDYYYYSSPVEPGEPTPALFTSSVGQPEQPADAPATGLTYELQILAQSIQADGVDSNGAHPVTLAWGVQYNPDTGIISAN